MYFTNERPFPVPTRLDAVFFDRHAPGPVDQRLARCWSYASGRRYNLFSVANVHLWLRYSNWLSCPLIGLRDMAFMSCRAVMKRFLFVVPCIACLVMFAVDFTGKQESPEEGKVESTKPIIHNMHVVCDPQNLCDFSPCRHGGTCYPRTESDGTKSFICVCAPGFGGKTCAGSKYHAQRL